MEYKSFHIKNFKGISDQTINRGKRSAGKVFTLVGLNESGKTSVLEAISSLDRSSGVVTRQGVVFIRFYAGERMGF